MMKQKSPRLSRRAALVGGAAALAASTLGIAGVRARQASPDTGSAELGPSVGAVPYVWTATSPATHKGDTYTLVVKNTGAETRTVKVRAVIMDHHAMRITPVIRQELTLDPGAEETLTATNDYGDANHFATRILSESNSGLDLQVTLSDATGRETATFNQGAFWVQSRRDLRRELRGELRDHRRTRRARRRQRRHHHD